MRKALYIVTILLSALAVQAQDQIQKSPVIVVGKVLEHKDSIRLRELYFDGLHEKIVQNIPRAEENFRQVLEIDPQNDAAMFELAHISHGKKQDSEAERFIRQAVTVSPENAWYWAFLAELYKQTNQIEELVPVLDELIKLKPGNEDYYYDKANALSILRRMDQAVAAYTEIENRFGESEELTSARQRILLQQGKPAQVEAELGKQILDHPEDIRNYIYLSEVIMKSGDSEKALALLIKARDIDPQNAMVRLSLADIYRKLKQSENAFIELKAAFEDPALNIDEKVRIVLSFFPSFSDMRSRANADELAAITVRVHPQEAKAFSLYGDVLFQESKLPEARAAYSKALKLNDQIYQIWEQMLRIGISLGDFAQVAKEGEEALLIFPNQGAIYLYTGIAYAQTQKPETAAPLLKSAADLLMDDNSLLGDVYGSLGDAYHSLKKYKESNESYEKALQINPSNAFVLNNYAYYLSLRGENLEKAEAMSKKANELDPDNSSSQDTYAWILFRTKNYKEAKIWIEKAISNRQGGSATLEEHYGDILFMLGEHARAVQQWQKAKSLGSASEKLERKINEKKYIE